MFNFLAVDPSLRNTGWVYGARYTNGRLKILDYGVIETNPSMSNIVCVQKIFRGLTKYNYTCLVAESLSGAARSAKAAWSLSAAQAIVTCVVEHKRCKYVEHTPVTIKKAVGNYKKMDIIKWAMKQYPEIKTWNYHNGRVTQSYNEHLADALAIMFATEKLRKWRT